MSWTDYTNYLVTGGQLASGYVLGINDGLIWAASTNETSLGEYDLQIEDDNGNQVTVKVNETLALLAAINNNDKNEGGKGVPPSKNFPQGFRISNVKYFLASQDEENNVFYYKSKQGGMCMALTNQAIIIGTFGQGQTPGDCNQRVEALQKQLLDSNY